MSTIILCGNGCGHDHSVLALLDALATAEDMRKQAEAEVQRLAALISEPTKTVEHAFMRAGVMVYGPSKFPRWNQYMTYAEAIERWYPGAKHVRRVHTDPDTYTEWEEVTDE